MNEQSLLYLSADTILNLFNQDFPEIRRLALQNSRWDDFKEQLKQYVYHVARRYYVYNHRRISTDRPVFAAAKRILRTLRSCDSPMKDAATGDTIRCDTFRWLWEMLRGENPGGESDFIMDLYHLFRQLHTKRDIEYQNPKQQMERWAVGRDDTVFYERTANRKLIIDWLVSKVENHHYKKFAFTAEMDMDTKREMVGKWWYDYHFQNTVALHSINELFEFIKDFHLSQDKEIQGIETNHSFGFISPYYLSLFSVRKRIDDETLRSYIIASGTAVRRKDETWKAILKDLLENSSDKIYLTDIDLFMEEDNTIRRILHYIYKTVKRRDVETQIRQIRISTGIPVILPFRVTDSLVELLRLFKERLGEECHIRFIIETHFISPLEVTVESRAAVQKLLGAGWIVVNRYSYTVAASRRGHASRLRRELNRIGVICDYILTVHSNHELVTPMCRMLQESSEEKRIGILPEDGKLDYGEALKVPHTIPARLEKIMNAHAIPFLATDKSVMNIPSIGKSCTFSTIGVTKEGKRVLHFKDRHQKKRISAYVIEDKSVASYLRQLEQYGEKEADYQNVWFYNESK